MEDQMALERFVMQYENTDGYTYWCTVTIPVKYISLSDFKRDFELAAIKAYLDSSDEIKVGTMSFPIRAGLDDGEFVPPTYFTLDEWFA